MLISRCSDKSVFDKNREIRRWPSSWYPTDYRLNYGANKRVPPLFAEGHLPIASVCSDYLFSRPFSATVLAKPLPPVSGNSCSWKLRKELVISKGSSPLASREVHKSWKI